jgi:hypothetical protein
MRCDRRWSARRIGARWWSAEVPPDPAPGSSRRRLRSWGPGWSSRFEHNSARSQEPPKGFPLIGSHVAVPSTIRNLRRHWSVDPKIHRSLVPLALPHGGFSRTRHLWTADGAVPATITPKGSRCKSRPGFRASNEPARRPVRGRRPKGALSERLRLERDPAARGCIERRTPARVG